MPKRRGATRKAKSQSSRKAKPRSLASVRKQLAVQRVEAKAKRLERAARAAAGAYKPRLKDRGKLILVGVKGQRDPQKKGRKGYLVYVTTTGKKQLQHLKGVKEPFKPRKLKEIELPLKKNLHRKVEQFKLSQRKVVKRGRASEPIEAKIHKQVKKTGLMGSSAAELEDFRLTGKGKGSGKVTTGGAYDFNDKAVDKIARHLRGVIKKQAGQRSFSIEVIGLIQLPDGSKEVIRFGVPIARNDKDAIRIAGIKNFVRHKFYAFMAQQLAFMGYVSTGSANHIRRLADNQGVEPGEYVGEDGQEWRGNDLEIVRILTLEWRIEQA